MQQGNETMEPPPAAIAAPGATDADGPQAPGTNPGMRLVKGYAAVYAALFIAYFAYSFIGYREINPVTGFIDLAFTALKPAGGNGYAAIDPTRLEANFDERRGHVRVWRELSFTGEHGARYKVPAGVRLTRDEAVALARAILRDERQYRRELALLRKLRLQSSVYDEKVKHLEAQRTVKRLLLYKPGWYLPWPLIMTLYNLGGLFLLLSVFVRPPLKKFLDDNAAVTRQALARAREAEAEAQRLQERYRQALREIEAERGRMQERAPDELAAEREAILDAARQEARTMVAHLEEALAGEVRAAAAGLRAEVAREAVKQACAQLAAFDSDALHRAAVQHFTRGLARPQAGGRE